MLALVVALCAGQVLAVPNPEGPIFSSPALTGSGAFFEFAPASGAGMGTACACTTPTGAKGEALTFTRAGDATCSKQGLATTGIANGDLVVCTANQPRVESSGGVLGLRVEGARTNETLRSQELNNAAWTWENLGAAATTRTNDFAVAPDGTTTAERLEIPATSGVQYSDVYQSFTVGAGSAIACSVYVKGNGTSGTTDLCGYGGGVAWSCSACSFVSASWTRCLHPITTDLAATSRFCKLGNNSNQNGGVARSAVDVLAWGMQGEAGAYATSYIPTVAAAVTRNDDRAEFAFAFSPTAGMCTAATTEYSSLANLPTSANLTAPILSVGAVSAAVSSPYWWPFFSTPSSAIDSLGVMTAGTVSYVPGITAMTSPGRQLQRHPGGVVGYTVCVNGTCSTNGTTSTWGTPAFTRLILDRASAAVANVPQHIISRVQVDPDSTRCTP